MNRRTLLGSLVAGAGASALPAGEGQVVTRRVPRSIRQWDEVLDLGGRVVPLRRFHVEGIDPWTVRYIDPRYGEGGGCGLDLRWSEEERDVRLYLRGWYLLEEGLSLGYRVKGVLSLHAWRATAVWGGAVLHAASVSRGSALSREDLRVVASIDDFES